MGHVALVGAMLALGGCLGGDETAGSSALPAARFAASAPVEVTEPFVLDAQRILVELTFRRPDGGERRAMAWLNMGVPGVVLASPLYRELQVAPGRPLRFRLGEMPVEVDSATVTDGPGRMSGEDDFEHFFGPRPVEAILPAGVLKTFTVILDFDARKVTLARPGMLRPAGTPIAIEVNNVTGLIATDAVIAGEHHEVAIDAGAPYTWFRGEVVAPWLAAHPAWRRGDGAVGLSNAGMTDYALEKQGTVVRIPMIDIGGVATHDVGALATAPFLSALGDRLVGNLFWDTWQRSAPRPVAGWIGNNVLKAFKVMVDYRAHTLYLDRRHDLDPHDLDQVGVSLLRRDSDYYVAGIVSKEGAPSVQGVMVGDRIASVDGRELRGEGRATVLGWLAGDAQVRHRLTIERAGTTFDVDVCGTTF